MSPDILCVANQEGYFIDVNPAFTKILGYTREELLSKPFIHFIYPDDIQKTKDNSKGKSVSNFENRYIHKDGGYRILSWSSSIDENTNLIYATARDITDTRYTELKLNEVTHALSDHLIIAITDDKGIITEVNDKFCQISGYTKSELIGKTHNIVNSGVHPLTFWDNLWGKISSGETWVGTIQNKTKAGERYFVHSIISPQIGSQGLIEGYMSIRFDITKEILLKEELAKTLKILNDTNSIAKVGGWELIVATNELNWTDETFKILEVQKNKDQKPVLPEGIELFVPEHKPVIERAVRRAIENGERYNLELQALTAKGNKLWVSTNGKPHYEDGKVVKLTGTIQDINFRKITELSLENERLKSIQSAKLATLGEFSAGIAHEITNPLAIIVGSVQSLPRVLDQKDKLSKKLEVIEKSCKRISVIAKNLVRHARKSSDQDIRPNQISTVIQDSIDLAILKAKQFDTNLQFESTADGLILCNEIELEQVFINLINNAVDAIKELEDRWVKISVTEENDKIIVKVVDSGTGLTQDIADKIFEPFYSSKKIGEGTGLGLSISKGIVENHNGSISIDHDCENTCFTVVFPRYIEKI
jgi:PAS domain S-box-containing protein